MVLESLESETPNIKDLSIEASETTTTNELQEELDRFWNWEDVKYYFNKEIQKVITLEIDNVSGRELLVKLAEILMIFPKRRSEFILDDENISDQIYNGFWHLAHFNDGFTDDNADEVIALKMLFPQRFDAEKDKDKLFIRLDSSKAEILKWKSRWLDNVHNYDNSAKSVSESVMINSLISLMKAISCYKFAFTDNEEVQEAIELTDEDWEAIMRLIHTVRLGWTKWIYSELLKNIRLINEKHFQELITDEEIQHIHDKVIDEMKIASEIGSQEITETLAWASVYAIVSAGKVVADNKGVRLLDKEHFQEDQPAQLPEMRNF